MQQENVSALIVWKTVKTFLLLRPDDRRPDETPPLSAGIERLSVKSRCCPAETLSFYEVLIAVLPPQLRRCGHCFLSMTQSWGGCVARNVCGNNAAVLRTRPTDCARQTGVVGLVVQSGGLSNDAAKAATRPPKRPRRAGG